MKQMKDSIEEYIRLARLEVTQGVSMPIRICVTDRACYPIHSSLDPLEDMGNKLMDTREDI